MPRTLTKINDERIKMSMQYCEDCDKQIDTDFDAGHFDSMFDSLSADVMSQVDPVNEEDISKDADVIDELAKRAEE